MATTATGTRDIHYDLVSVLYHTLQEADTIDTYIEDASRRGDDALAGFFEEIQDRIGPERIEPSRCWPTASVR